MKQQKSDNQGVNIDLREATEQQKPILANLLELYAYEFSEYWKFDIGDNGFYGYDDLPLYWTDKNKFPYIVYINDKIAGFVLVQKGAPGVDDKDVWDIAEFFIMRKYRKQGIGAIIANTTWKLFKGKWQIRVLQENTESLRFWEYAIQQFTSKKLNKSEFHYDKYDWYLFKFNSE